MEQLSKEQEEALLIELHARMVQSISLTEALKIVSAFAMDKLIKDIAAMSDDQKVQTYLDLDLK